MKQKLNNNHNLYLAELLIHLLLTIWQNEKF